MSPTSPPLRLLVASDKFKGSLTGPEACAAIAEGLREALGDAVEIRESPIADGGDGMARAVTAARQGEWRTTSCQDALGRPLEAGFGLITNDKGQRLGVIEMAEASGLWRLETSELDPWRASTRGTGELVRAALDAGADRILLGIGGSATNDGGTGMAAALGIQFRNAKGQSLDDLPNQLDEAVSIEIPEAMRSLSMQVACDVTNPLLGSSGCTRVYGPQKGIRPEDIPAHERRLEALVGLLPENGSAFSQVAGSGAAGGLGFGCLAFFNAQLRPGFDLVSDVLGLEEAVQWSNLVITGEGKLDDQTMQGKAPAGVAALARRLGKPVAALAGTLAPDASETLSDHFDFFAAIDRGHRDLEEAMRDARPLLAETARGHAREIADLARPR